jgi:hypothetical protein
MVLILAISERECKGMEESSQSIDIPMLILDITINGAEVYAGRDPFYGMEVPRPEYAAPPLRNGKPIERETTYPVYNLSPIPWKYPTAMHEDVVSVMLFPSLQSMTGTLTVTVRLSSDMEDFRSWLRNGSAAADEEDAEPKQLPASLRRWSRELAGYVDQPHSLKIIKKTVWFDKSMGDATEDTLAVAERITGKPTVFEIPVAPFDASKRSETIRLQFPEFSIELRSSSRNRVKWPAGNPDPNAKPEPPPPQKQTEIRVIKKRPFWKFW